MAMAVEYQLISSFLDVAVGQSSDTAIRFLDTTGWMLEDALQLYYAADEGTGVLPSSLSSSPHYSPPEVVDDGVQTPPSEVLDEGIRPSSSSWASDQPNVSESYPSDVKDDVLPYSSWDTEQPSVWESYLSDVRNDVLPSSSSSSVRESYLSDVKDDVLPSSSIVRDDVLRSSPSSWVSDQPSVWESYLSDVRDNLNSSQSQHPIDNTKSDSYLEDTQEDGILPASETESDRLLPSSQYSGSLSAEFEEGSPPSSSSIQPTGWGSLPEIEDDEVLPSAWPTQSSGWDNSSPELGFDRRWESSSDSPPNAFICYGTIHEAKIEASEQDKWLLVNFQSDDELSSWPDEAMAQKIRTNFVLWQVYQESEEGEKVFSWYKLISTPVTLLVDPITGQKLHEWSGDTEPQDLLEDLLQYMDKGPKEQYVMRPNEEKPMENVGSSETVQPEEVGSPEYVQSEEVEVKERNESNKMPSYPPLPEEPKGEKELLCRVGIRLPDGRRVQRTFLRSDPVQLLWSFSYTLMEEEETRPFHFLLPGVLTKRLDFGNSLTFDEACLSSSMISMAFD